MASMDFLNQMIDLRDMIPTGDQGFPGDTEGPKYSGETAKSLLTLCKNEDKKIPSEPFTTCKEEVGFEDYCVAVLARLMDIETQKATGSERDDFIQNSTVEGTEINLVANRIMHGKEKAMESSSDSESDSEDLDVLISKVCAKKVTKSKNLVSPLDIDPLYNNSDDVHKQKIAILTKKVNDFYENNSSQEFHEARDEKMKKKMIRELFSEITEKAREAFTKEDIATHKSLRQARETSLEEYELQLDEKLERERIVDEKIQNEIFMSTPHHEQTRKMLEVCKPYKLREILKPAFSYLLPFTSSQCSQCAECTKSFVLYVEQFVKCLFLFQSHTSDSISLPINVEYFFHLSLDDIFADLDTETPTLKESLDLDLRRRLKDMSMVEIYNLLAGMACCELLKKNITNLKDGMKNGGTIKYLLTVIKKELGMELNALDMEIIGQHYVNKVNSDVPKAVKYLRKGCKLAFEAYRKDTRHVMYCYQDQHQEKPIMPGYWLELQKHIFGYWNDHPIENTKLVRSKTDQNLAPEKAYRESKELIQQLTRGEFREWYEKDPHFFKEYNFILRMMILSYVMDESVDCLYLCDLLIEERKKFDKLINVPASVKKKVEFDKSINMTMETIWLCHAWGQYAKDWPKETPIEVQTTIDTDEANANIIVNKKCRKHSMNEKKQFIVESLDKAVRIAKDGDVIFLKEGTYESSNRNQNGKRCYEFSKNLTLIGARVKSVHIISPIVKFTNSTVKFKRLTISPSTILRDPYHPYKNYEEQESCYIIEGTTHFENVKFALDKDTCIFVVHASGKESPFVTFKYCTVGSLFKEFGQEHGSVTKNRRFLSFSGENPKIIMDTCLIKEISSVIGVLETDILPKKTKNLAGDEVDVPNCAEITIKDCQIIDCLSVFVFEQKSEISSGMKVSFKRNNVKWQSADYKWQKCEMQIVQMEGPRKSFMEGNKSLIYSNTEMEGIKITEAKEVVVTGNSFESRSSNIKMVEIERADKFNFETNSASNTCGYLNKPGTTCIQVYVKEALIQNNQIFGFHLAMDIVVNEEYSYLGILDSDIQNCAKGIVIRKKCAIDRCQMRDSEKSLPYPDNYLNQLKSVDFMTIDQAILTSETKVTISNIVFDIVNICISIPGILCFVDISACNFSHSCALPIELSHEIIVKKMAQINNKSYGDDNDLGYEVYGMSSIEYLLKDKVPTMLQVIKYIVGNKINKTFRETFTDPQKKKFYAIMFLQYQALARRDKETVETVIGEYKFEEKDIFGPDRIRLFLETLLSPGFSVLGKEDEVKVNATNVNAEQNLEDEVD